MKGVGDKNAQARRYTKKYPERSSALFKVYRAVRDDKLIKPVICSKCEQQKDKIQAHHEDYTKPLEVIWLCELCHHIEHGRGRN